MAYPKDWSNVPMAPIGPSRTEIAQLAAADLADNHPQLLVTLETEAERTDFVQRLAAVKLRALIWAYQHGHEPLVLPPYPSAAVPLVKRFVFDLSPAELEDLHRKAERAACAKLSELLDYDDDDDLHFTINRVDDFPEYIAIPVLDE
jgi:hypothetical protein